jgi:hypothetical protein
MFIIENILFADTENSLDYSGEIISPESLRNNLISPVQILPPTNSPPAPADGKSKEECWKKCLKEFIAKFPKELAKILEWKTLCIFILILSVIWMAGCILIPSDFILPIVHIAVFPYTIPVHILWIITIGVFIADGIAIGYYLTERRSGIVINERKLMSLSRVQVAVWSLLILSALFTIFVVRLRSGVADWLNVGIDLQVWALMGISLGSLAGRTAIMGKKSAATPKADKLKKAAELAANNLKGENEATIITNATGVLYVNGSIKDASLMDMFQCDEVGNTWVVDIGKVQMFFFTVITVVTYAAAIWVLLLHTAIGSITSLPPMTDGFVAILGVSHAGLLANSATTQMPTDQP